MKTSLLLFSFLVFWLAGCRSVASEADDVVRVFGDDIARFANRYGDDIARTSEQYADDVGRQLKYSDEAVAYWERIIQSQQVDDGYRLIYRHQKLSSLQTHFVSWLQAETRLNDNEALLYLQTVCSVAGYVEFYNEYPSNSSSQFYVEKVAEQNGIQIFSIVEFADSALSFTRSLIEGDTVRRRQEAAGLLFDGLCLVSDTAGN